MAALADTPPRQARPVLPPKSSARTSIVVQGDIFEADGTSRSRSASTASLAPSLTGKRSSNLVASTSTSTPSPPLPLSSTTPLLGLSQPRPRNPPTRTPSLSNTASASSRASSSVFTPSSSAIRGSAYSRDGDTTDWATGSERENGKEELDFESAAEGALESADESAVEGSRIGGRRFLRHGSGSPRRQPIAAIRIDEPSTQLGFGLGGLGIAGWEGTTSADGSPLVGFGESDDLQRDMEEFSRFARSLPSPIPPLSARSQVNGGWTSLPPDLQAIAGVAPLPLSATPSPANSPLVQSSPSVDTRASRRREASTGSRSSEGRSPSVPRPSVQPNSASSSPGQFFDASSSLHPPAISTRSPLAAEESDAYLSESGVEDFLSDDDDGVGGESYARHYLPFAAGLGISGVPGERFLGSAPAGGRRDWDEEEVLDATDGKAGVVDWSESAIERMVVPTDTTHIILARSTTPRQVPLLLRKVIPTLALGLVVLDISNCSLLEVPLAIASCSSLQELDIKGNVMATRTLPAFLATLPALRVLIADACGLTELPSSLSQLTRLHTLSIRFNALRALPSWICRLEQLETLAVDGNPFHFTWSKVISPIVARQPGAQLERRGTQATQASSVVGSSEEGGRTHESARSSLASSVGVPLARSLELPPGLSSPPPPSVPDLRSVASKASLRSVSATQPFTSPPPSFTNISESLPASPIPGQHSFSTPPPASAPHVSLAEAQARLRHQSDRIASPALSQSVPPTPPSATDSASSSSKKWSSKIFKKAGARLRSGSSSSRPGMESRGYSEPITKAEESEVQATPPLPKIRSRVLSRPGKLPPALALKEEERNMGKRRSFLQLDTSPVLGGEVMSTSPIPASPVDTKAGLRSVMAYLRDLEDLSTNLTLPAIPLDSASPSPVLRHSPSLGSISPSPSPTPSLGIRRAQSSRRLPSRIGRSQSGRFSQFMDDEGAVTSGRATPLPAESSATSSTAATTSSEEAAVLKLKDDATKREKVVKEIVDTEKSYLKGLQELCDIYIVAGSVPVNSNSGRKDTVLPGAERRAVFGNVEAIRDFHEKIFLPDLLEAVQSSPAPSLPSADTSAVARDVARVFVRHAAFLKIYSSYVNGFDAALARIQSWAMDSTRPTTSSGASPQIGSGSPHAFDPSAAIVTHLSTNKRKRIKSYLKVSFHRLCDEVERPLIPPSLLLQQRCKANPGHSQISLESYLLLPVQRVPRYRMLLESLVACTPLPPRSTSMDLLTPSPSVPIALEPNPIIQEALDLIADVATAMNEKKRETEGRAQLLYWQGRIGNRFRSPLVQPHRTLLRSGTWTLVRTVKRSSTYIDQSLASSTSSNTETETVHTLHNEAANQNLIALLCTDLLVLAKEPANPSDQQATVDLYTVLRLSPGQIPRPPPASLFGSDHSMLRITCDSRAILYIQCARKSEAVSWMNAINTQVTLNT
ncbi:hypothetical protein BCR35DRAFT_41254 [Leucosporidium creatinivorum]|uniref:DH domain-containing protein n=1 Tax=Leucosporidium creatinivorum TaxID=106004 RepID=A0A1Y2C5Z2_9BASI|nr:hypothetical protein BCR35DRAFT_41254 [Leucosporidium creatinivorum]